MHNLSSAGESQGSPTCVWSTYELPGARKQTSPSSCSHTHIVFSCCTTLPTDPTSQPQHPLQVYSPTAQLQRAGCHPYHFAYHGQITAKQVSKRSPKQRVLKAPKHIGHYMRQEQSRHLSCTCFSLLFSVSISTLLTLFLFLFYSESDSEAIFDLKRQDMLNWPA